MRRQDLRVDCSPGTGIASRDAPRSPESSLQSLWPSRAFGRITLGLAALAGLAGLGTRVRPAPFPLYGHHGPIESIAPPGGLPAPVERFYRELYGERIPVIHSAVLSGRATMTIQGIALPARVRFVHEAGMGYRHYFEVTYFGAALMKVDESYLDGHELMRLPFGTFEGPTYDAAGNLGMWAELLAWLPAALLGDTRVRWGAIDDTTAWLLVPFGAQQERLLVRFDPETGLVHLVESMRYKDQRPRKTLWMNQALAYGEVGGYRLMSASALTWQDSGRPWATIFIEEAVYNAEVRDYVRARGR